MRVRTFAALACLLGLAMPGPARGADGKPIRHLEYRFAVALNAEMTTHDSGIYNGRARGGPAPLPVAASGINHRAASGGSSGIITVDVDSVLTDGGLGVTIAERFPAGQRVPPAACVTYGSTYVLCDTSKQVTSEEIELLRFLGRNFADEGLLDVNRHWQYRQQTGQLSETTDYIIRNDDAGTLSIELTRTTSSPAGGVDASSDGRVIYSRLRSLPTELKLRTVSRTEGGPGTSNRTQMQLDLTLLSDSMGVADTH